MGTLPRELFDRLYTYENSWAPVREGASSFNTLILTGRAHMRCGFGWDYDRPTENQRLWVHEFHEKFCRGEVSWLKHGAKLASEVGKYFIEAHDRNSSLSQWFLGWQQEAIVPENNRIIYGIDEAIKLLEPASKKIRDIPEPGYISESEWKGKTIYSSPDSLGIVLTLSIGNGVIAGLSDTLKYNLKKKKFSTHFAEAAKLTAYFASTFAMHFCHSYTSQDSADSWQRATNSFYEAGVKTGKLMAVHAGLFATTKIISRYRAVSNETTQCVKKTISTTYLAYQFWQKPLTTALAAVTSTVSEKITQKLVYRKYK